MLTAGRSSVAEAGPVGVRGGSLGAREEGKPCNRVVVVAGAAPYRHFRGGLVEQSPEATRRRPGGGSPPSVSSSATADPAPAASDRNPCEDREPGRGYVLDVNDHDGRWSCVRPDHGAGERPPTSGGGSLRKCPARRVGTQQRHDGPRPIVPTPRAAAQAIRDQMTRAERGGRRVSIRRGRSQPRELTCLARHVPLTVVR